MWPKPLSGEGHRLSTPFDCQRDAAVTPSHRSVGQAGLDRDPLSLQRVGQRLGHFRFHAGQKARTRDQCNLDAQPRRHLRQFTANIAAAQYQDAFGLIGQAEKVPGIQRLHGLDPVNFRQERARAGGDQNLRCSDDPPADLNPTFDQACGTFLDIGDILIGRQQVDVFFLAHLVDQIGRALDDRRPVHALRTGLNARKPCRRCTSMHRFTGPYHRLGRHAADIDAGAADGAMPNHGHAPAGLGRANRSRKPGRASTYDDEVIAVVAVFIDGAAIACLYGLIHYFFLGL